MAEAQYAIDVAANMSGGEHTSAELDALTLNLMGAGKGAEFFSEALKTVSAQVTAAAAASASANEALKAGQAEYAQLEKAALKAAKAEEAAAQKGTLTPDLARASHEAAAALEKQAQALKGLEANAAQANASEAKLVQTQANLKKLSGHVDKSLAGQSEALGKLQGGLGAIGGPLGSLGNRILGPVKGFSELSQTMGAANAAALAGVVGFAALAAAVVAITVAVVAGTIAIAAWAVGLADGARSAALAREAIEAANPSFAALGSEIDNISSATGQGVAELAALEKQLRAAKVSASDMPAALRAAATAEAALGKGASADFLENIKAGKVAVGDLAAETQSKFGGIVAKQMRGLDAQSKRLHHNIGEIFGGLNIEPVLSGLETLVALFDKNTAAGQAMKFLFESVFQPLINQAENAAYVVEAFALGFLIGMTKVYIALKPIFKAITEFFGFEDTSLTDTLDLAKNAGELIAPVFLALVVVFGAVVAIIGLAVAQLFLIPAAAAAVVAAVIAAGVAVGGWFVEMWQKAVAFLQGVDLGEIGSNIIAGLAAGIRASAGQVIAALGGVVDGAVNAVKAKLGIASPSKVFAGLGVNTGEGFVEGVDAMAGDAEAAMSGLVEPPDTSSPLAKQAKLGGGGGASAGASSGPGGGGRGGGALVVQGNTFKFYGVENAEAAEARFEEVITKLWEGDAAMLSPEADE